MRRGGGGGQKGEGGERRTKIYAERGVLSRILGIKIKTSLRKE